MCRSGRHPEYACCYCEKPGFFSRPDILSWRAACKFWLINLAIYSAPGESERQTNGWKDVDLVIDEWILLEYACTFLPAQQNAMVEAVSKSSIQLPEEFIQALELDPLLFQSHGGDEATRRADAPTLAGIARFTPLDEIEKALLRHVNSIDLHALAKQTAQQVLDKARGRV